MKKETFIYHLICVGIFLDVKIESKVNNILLNLNKFTLQTRDILVFFFKCMGFIDRDCGGEGRKGPWKYFRLREQHVTNQESLTKFLTWIMLFKFLFSKEICWRATIRNNCCRDCKKTMNQTYNKFKIKMSLLS